MEGFTLTTSIKIDKKARQGIKTIPCIKNVLLNLTSNWLFNTNCHRVTSRYVTSFFEIFFNLMFLMSMSGWRRVVRLSTPMASRPSGSSHIRTRSTTTRRRTAASAIQSRKFTTVYNSFLKMGQPWHLFRLFLAFSNKQYIFYNKSMWKHVHPVYGTRIQTHNPLITSRHPYPLDQGSCPGEKIFIITSGSGQWHWSCWETDSTRFSVVKNPNANLSLKTTWRKESYREREKGKCIDRLDDWNGVRK